MFRLRAGRGDAGVFSCAVLDDVLGVTLFTDEAVEDTDHFFLGNSAKVVEGLKGRSDVGACHGEGDVIPTGKIAWMDLKFGGEGTTGSQVGAADDDGEQILHQELEVGLALLELAVSGATGGFGCGTGGAFGFGEEVERNADAGGNHLLKGKAVAFGIRALEFWGEDFPGFGFIGNEDRARGRGIEGELGLAGLAGRFAGVGRFDDVQKGVAVAVEADAVIQEGGVAGEPLQDGGKVTFTPNGTSWFVDRIVNDTRLEVGEEFVFTIEGFVLDWVQVVGIFDCERKFLFEVVGMGVDLLDEGGRDDTDIGHATCVGGNEDEEVAGAGERVAELDKAGVHAVKRMGPDLFQESIGGDVIAGNGKTCTNDILADNLNDPAGEGVVTPGVKALCQDVIP